MSHSHCSGNKNNVQKRRRRSQHGLTIKIESPTTGEDSSAGIIDPANTSPSNIYLSGNICLDHPCFVVENSHISELSALSRICIKWKVNCLPKVHFYCLHCTPLSISRTNSENRIAHSKISGGGICRY